MGISEAFKQEIAPFFYVSYEGGNSVCLDVGSYLQEVFDTRADEGFVGNGYDWQSLAIVFLQEKCPDLLENIKFDSESSMFSAYSTDTEALQDFIRRFKRACEEKPLILDLFQRAALD